MGTTQLKDRRCLLLGGGEIRDYHQLKGLLRPEDYVICADSGYSHCARLGVCPQLLVGDFDSLKETPPSEIPRLDYHPEKDYTDMALAIETAVEWGSRELLLAGGLGGRLDHTLGNLQSLADLSRRGIQAQLTDGATHIWAVTAGAKTLEPAPGHYFSLFAVGGDCRGVTIRGAKYLLDRFSLGAFDPRAVSNEFLDRPVEISVEQGTIVVVVTPMDR